MDARRAADSIERLRAFTRNNPAVLLPRMIPMPRDGWPKTKSCRDERGKRERGASALSCPNDAAARAASLCAALRLFVRHGIDATSVRDIAAGSGFTNPAIFKHFDSKEALALCLFERCYTWMGMPLEPPVKPSLAVRSKALGHRRMRFAPDRRRSRKRSSTCKRICAGFGGKRAQKQGSSRCLVISAHCLMQGADRRLSETCKLRQSSASSANWRARPILGNCPARLSAKHNG